MKTTFNNNADVYSPRFRFGENWLGFSEEIDDGKIQKAEQSLIELLDMKSLKGKQFLDIGSGSGIFSLAAKNLGANVRSFDFDNDAVKCAKALKAHYYPDDPRWVVEAGSVLDSDFILNIGKHSIVYSWGVLHHTGAMWNAILHASQTVKQNGTFVLAIYNNQGIRSHLWWIVKYFFNKFPYRVQKPLAKLFSMTVEFAVFSRETIKGRGLVYYREVIRNNDARGMTKWVDITDWYGGFPYEYAEYDTLVQFVQSLGFKLIKGHENFGLGCHQLVFKKSTER